MYSTNSAASKGRISENFTGSESSRRLARRTRGSSWRSCTLMRAALVTAALPGS